MKKGVCSLCARSRTSSHFTSSIIDGLPWWGKAQCACLAGWMDGWMAGWVVVLKCGSCFFRGPRTETGGSGTSCERGGGNRRGSGRRSAPTMACLGDWLDLPNALGPIERSQMCEPRPSDAWSRWKCLHWGLKLISMPSRYLTAERLIKASRKHHSDEAECVMNTWITGWDTMCVLKRDWVKDKTGWEPREISEIGMLPGEKYGGSKLSKLGINKLSNK